MPPPARGEQAASALETGLSSLESRLDEMLDAFEDKAAEVAERAAKKKAAEKEAAASSAAAAAEDDAPAGEKPVDEKPVDEKGHDKAGDAGQTAPGKEQ